MSIKETLARLQAQYGNYPGLEDKSFFDQIGGLPGDFISGLAETVGIEKSPEQLLRERKYPVTTFLGDMAGMAVPYAGWSKALKAVPTLKRFDKVVDAMNTFGDNSKSPIKNAMMREVARWGTLEAGLGGIGLAVPGGMDLGETFGQAATNTLLAGGVGGLGAALTAGGKRAAPLQEIFKDIDPNATNWEQMRQLNDAIASGKIAPEHMVEARNRASKYAATIRAETPKSGQPYVGATFDSDGKLLSRLFNSQSTGTKLVRRRLIRGVDDGFDSDAAWKGVIQQAGLPEDWLYHAKFPRYQEATGIKAAKQMQKVVNDHMAPMGDGWHLTRENNDGLFVMAKKLSGEGATGYPGDRWITFKTDKPDHFLPESSKWSGAVADHMLFMARDARPVGPVAPIYDSARKIMETLPLRPFVENKAYKGSAAEVAAGVGKALGVDDALKNTGEVTKRAKDFLVEHIVPTVHQFGRSPRAGRAFAVAQATYDSALSEVRRRLFGERALDPKKTPFSHLLGATTATTGPAVKDIVDKMSADELTRFWEIVRSKTPIEQVDELFANGDITENTRNLARELKSFSDDLAGQTTAVENATGGGNTKPIENDYLLYNRWEGTNRVAIRDASDNVVAMGSGHSREGAKRHAEQVLKQLEREGETGLQLAEDFDITNTKAMPRDIQALIRSPSWVLENQRLRGYKFDDKPWTKDELIRELETNALGRTRYMADRTTKDLLADDIAKVAIEDPTMHRILTGRLHDLQGQQTPLGKMMNQAVDTVLGPVLGGNSASQIVSGTNKLMWHLELGALRAAYPAMNMLTFLQTTIPEVSFVGSGNADVLSKYYKTFTKLGAKGGKPMGMLDPLKLWVQGTKQMHAKDAGFTKAVEQGINDGLLDPRYVEEFTGQIGARAKWNEALKTEGGFMKWLEAISEYLPAQSEKWSRLNAFSTGWVVGKDLLKLNNADELYTFAKDFTNRTMFRYGMDARPRLFTTPAGSLLGLFKNWMMHYVGTMMDYTGEGLKRNNWGPLLWQTAGTAAVGGASALPLWAVANGLSEGLTGKSALVNGYEAMEPAGEGFSDAVFFGLPSLAGISLSSNAAAPFSNPMRDVTQMMSLVHWNRVQAAQKMMGHAFDHAAATGESPLSDPNTRDQFLRAVSPKTVYRLASTLEDNVINSLSTGNPVLKDVGPMQKVWFSLGFNPTEVEKAYAVSDELWKNQENHRAAVQRYGEALYEAYRQNDAREIEVIVRRAMLDGVDVSSLERSAMARIAKDEGDILTRSFDPEELQQRLVVMGDDYKPPERPSR